MSLIIKAIIFYLAMFFVTYRLGLLVVHFTGKKNMTSIMLFGMTLLLAVFQIVLLPFIVLHVSFNAAYITTIISILLLLIVSFVVVRRKEEKEIISNWLINLKQQKRLDLTILIIVVILVLGQGVLSSYLFHENADDAYYVSLAEQSLYDDNLYMVEPSLGMEQEYSMLSSTEQITSYDLSMAVISKTFGIKPVVLYHSVIPFIFMIYCYLAYYYFAKVFMNHKYSLYFVLVLCVINLFTGFSYAFRSGYLICRLWQGKSIFINMSLTLLMALLMELQDTNNKKLIPLIMLTNIASVELTSSAIYIVPFTYMGFGISYLIKKQLKELPKLIISFIPMAIYIFILLILMKTSSLASNIPFVEQNMKQVILMYADMKYLIYYLISMLVIAIWGNKQEKLFFVTLPTIYAFTIWNPIFSDFITKYITSSDVFWRVIWLLPIEYSIAYAVVLATKMFSNKTVSLCVLLSSIVILIVSGKFMYTEENAFKIPENIEKIPQSIIDQTNYIIQNLDEEDGIMVLAPAEPLHSCTMRQLTTKIELLYSREMYFRDLISEEEQEDRKSLYTIYYQGTPEYGIEQFNEKLERYEVDWMILPTNRLELKEFIDKSILEEVAIVQDCYLYKVEK